MPRKKGSLPARERWSAPQRRLLPTVGELAARHLPIQNEGSKRNSHRNPLAGDAPRTERPYFDEPINLGKTPEPQNCRRNELESVNTPLRLLVVEDHNDLRMLLRMFFEELGYQARGAGDLASAMRIADEEPFDVLLSDIALPDGDGWELLQRLDQTGHRPRYAIAMSGFYGLAGYARSKAAGFAVHLVKPAAPVALEKALAVAGQAIALGEHPAGA